MESIPRQSAFWSQSIADLLQQLQTSPQGLSSQEARSRGALYGQNILKREGRATTIRLLLAQFESPLIIILILAALVSFFLGETIDATIVIGIVLLSGLLGFWQEKRAADAVAKLLSIVRINARVLRDGKILEVRIEDVVPGDIAILCAGNILPGDCRLLESKDLYVEEAALTGESFPAEKKEATLPPESPLAERVNSLWMGTHVISGEARAVVVRTGTETEFGMISQRLRGKSPETEFEHGVRRFGYLLTEITFILVLLLFGFSVLTKRPVFDSFLFAVALAVGMIPELLPAIISINLAIGAERMARKQVIVKQLASIENFGSMDVLCSDKTGTLTEGTVNFLGARDLKNEASAKGQLFAALNAAFESGFINPIDESIRKTATPDLSEYRKLDEVPYDFVRKRLSILVEKDGQRVMVTKGALANVLESCSHAEVDGHVVPIDAWREKIQERLASFSEQGIRTLGLAYRESVAESRISKDAEQGMTFLAFLPFTDLPREEIVQTIARLKQLGIDLKVITGDNRMVSAALAEKVYGYRPKIMTGAELHQLSNEALRQRAREVNVFAEVEPNQKERIILALRKAGHVVGYLGDGINDAAALHAADVGISVNNGVDIAKEAASIVLLEKDLGVLLEGVREGRTTFANTLKYVFMTTSANFGNMFSMAGAALFLPFLPLLPKQVLLNNFLSDFPAMAIATDTVDEEWIVQPRRWDVNFIRNFMIAFGIVSSVFDFMSFGALLYLLNATPDQFRTGWFLESVVTELLIVFVIRTWKPFYRSRMSRPLLISTFVVLVFTIALPYLPWSGLLGLVPLPPSYLLTFAIITGLYLLASEATKKYVYQRAMGSKIRSFSP